MDWGWTTRRLRQRVPMTGPGLAITLDTAVMRRRLALCSLLDPFLAQSLSDVASPETDDADRGKCRGHNDQQGKRGEHEVTARQSGQVSEGRHVHGPLVQPQYGA